MMQIHTYFIHLFLWFPKDEGAENDLRYAGGRVTDLASATNVGTQMMGVSADEEIAKNWQNLPPNATRAEHVGNLANVSLIFGTQILLHETVRQAFNLGC